MQLHLRILCNDSEPLSDLDMIFRKVCIILSQKELSLTGIRQLAPLSSSNRELPLLPGTSKQICSLAPLGGNSIERRADYESRVRCQLTCLFLETTGYQAVEMGLQIEVWGTRVPQGS